MQNRSENFEALGRTKFDVLVIGGGINGAVTAASLSARGVNVALIEKEDFASGVSSQSSNLAWGGIKYMESFELPLVRKLCKSRNRLTEIFPSAVREIRFLTVVRRDFRWPAWAVYLGSVLYWFLGSCKTRRPQYLGKAAIREREPVMELSDVAAGFEYSDCHFEDNDARFVFNMVKKAATRGATIVNYAAASTCEPTEDGWRVQCRDQLSEGSVEINAKLLVNACGPWVDELNSRSDQTTEHRHLLSKGVHLIVRQLTKERRVLTLFASDGRPFFVIPMGDKTCVGTTDTPTEDPLAGPTEADRQFILDNVNAGLALDDPLCVDDIIAERAGVRPLAVRGGEKGEDWLQLSRKHAIDIDAERAHLSIFGGKLTDCLNVGDAMADHMAELGLALEPLSEYWCGEADAEVKQRFMSAAAGLLPSAEAAGFVESPADRLWRRYDDSAFELLDLIQNDATLADRALECAEVLRCEVVYARTHEFVSTLDDFLRRRTRIAQLTRQATLTSDPGLADVCELLFGDAAANELARYTSQGLDGAPGADLPSKIAS